MSKIGGVQIYRGIIIDFVACIRITTLGMYRHCLNRSTAKVMYVLRKASMQSGTVMACFQRPSALPVPPGALYNPDCFTCGSIGERTPNLHLTVGAYGDLL